MRLVIPRLGDGLLPVRISTLVERRGVRPRYGGRGLQEARRIPEDIEVFGILGSGDRPRIIDLESPALALSGGDQDDPIRTTRTIDGRRGCVFQKVEGHDVRRGNG